MEDIFGVEEQEIENETYFKQELMQENFDLDMAEEEITESQE